MTTIQIEVDNDVLRDAEIAASNVGVSLSDLLVEHIEQLALQKEAPKRGNEVKTYVDLVEALAFSRKQIENKQTVPEEEVMTKIRQYAGLDDV